MAKPEKPPKPGKFNPFASLVAALLYVGDAILHLGDTIMATSQELVDLATQLVEAIAPLPAAVDALEAAVTAASNNTTIPPADQANIDAAMDKLRSVLSTVQASVADAQDGIDEAATKP